jgi:pimeloyl-ACP methyl ester carboxylesterase
MPSVSQRTIYYLPGCGGQLGTGLGQGLMDRGFDVTGRETRGDFRNLPFDEQVQTVMQDLQDHFWHEQAHVVCNSFGAYLFLHAQAELPAFVGRVLLLSPIVGEFTNEQVMTSFSPPRPERLKQLAQTGLFKAPVNCEIHVGEEDWQSIPANVQAFGHLTGIPVTVVPRGGHDLGKAYVGPLLDRWLV